MNKDNQGNNRPAETAADSGENGKLFCFPYLVVTLSFAIETLGYSMVSAHIASYAKEIGVAGRLLGLFPGMMSLTALFCRPFAGWISDHFNRRSVIRLMILSLTLVFLGYTFSASPLMLIIVRIFHGIAFSVFTTTNMSSVADVIPRKKLVQGMAYYSLFGNLVQSFAPSIGVWIRTNFGYRWMFLSVMILYGISFVLFAALPGQKTSQRRAESFHISIREIIAVEVLPLAMVAACAAMSNGALNGFVLIYAEGRGLGGGSLFFTASAIVAIITKPLISRFSKKRKPVILLYPGLFSMMLTMTTLALARSTAAVALAGALAGFGYSTVTSVIQGLVLGSVSESRRGIASGTYYIGLDIGNFLGPTVCGYIASWFAYDYGKSFLATGSVLIAGIVILFCRLRKERNAGGGR